MEKGKYRFKSVGFGIFAAGLLIGACSGGGHEQGSANQQSSTTIDGSATVTETTGANGDTTLPPNCRSFDRVVKPGDTDVIAPTNGSKRNQAYQLSLASKGVLQVVEVNYVDGHTTNAIGSQNLSKSNPIAHFLEQYGSATFTDIEPNAQNPVVRVTTCELP